MNGDLYEGMFLFDWMHGVGTLKLASGDSFEGRFQDNQRHGVLKKTSMGVVTFERWDKKQDLVSKTVEDISENEY